MDDKEEGPVKVDAETRVTHCQAEGSSVRHLPVAVTKHLLGERIDFVFLVQRAQSMMSGKVQQGPSLHNTHGRPGKRENGYQRSTTFLLCPLQFYPSPHSMG